MRREFGVAGSWESSRAELSQGPWPGRVRSRAEPSRAEPGAWAEASQEPSRARSRARSREAGGLGLEGLYWELVWKCLEWL